MNPMKNTTVNSYPSKRSTFPTGTRRLTITRHEHHVKSFKMC